jgi:hypothetical protein
LRLRHGLVGDGDAVRVVAAAADQRLLVFEPPHVVRVHPVDQPLHLGHDLGTDAVAGEEQELVGRHEI